MRARGKLRGSGRLRNPPLPNSTVSGASVDRAEVTVVDARGLKIREADRIGDVDLFLAAVQDRSQQLTIPWRFEVDGKKLVLASFPVTVTIVVFDTTGGRAEVAFEVDR